MTNNSAFSQCEIAPLIHNTNKNVLLLMIYYTKTWRIMIFPGFLSVKQQQNLKSLALSCMAGIKKQNKKKNTLCLENKNTEKFVWGFKGKTYQYENIRSQLCVLVWDWSVICCISSYDPGCFSHVFTGQIHFTHLSQTEGRKTKEPWESQHKLCFTRTVMNQIMWSVIDDECQLTKIAIIPIKL